MSRFTRVLFARPSLISGAARTLDIGGVFNRYHVSESPEAADLRALHADMMAVGEDMRTAADAVQRAAIG